MNLELLKTALEKHWRFPSSRGPDRITELKLRMSKNATEIAKATTKARLQELLAEKKNDELKNLSVEELEKKIAELS